MLPCGRVSVKHTVLLFSLPKNEDMVYALHLQLADSSRAGCIGPFFYPPIPIIKSSQTLSLNDSIEDNGSRGISGESDHRRKLSTRGGVRQIVEAPDVQAR